MYINRQPSQGGGRGTLPASVKHLRWILHGSVVLVSISLAIGVFDKSLFSWHPGDWQQRARGTQGRVCHVSLQSGLQPTLLTSARNLAASLQSLCHSATCSS